MTEELVIEIILMLIQTIGMVVAPVIVVTIIVGVGVNILQTITSIKDPALAFVPKVVAASIVLVVAAPWYLKIMKSFLENMIELISRGPM